MIERLHRIATLLSRYRPVLLILAALGFILVLGSLVGNPWLASYEWLMPALALFLWALLLYSLSWLFLTIPGPEQSGMAWRQRIARRFRRALLWVAAALFLALSAAVLFLSYQLLRVSLL